MIIIDTELTSTEEVKIAKALALLFDLGKVDVAVVHNVYNIEATTIFST